MLSQPLIHCENLVKTYKFGKTAIHALNGIFLDISKGEFVAIIGSSGSGKSTLMNLLGGLDQPTSGTISINGDCLNTLSHRRLARFRNQTIGFVFQQFQLLAKKTALQNVILPLQYRKRGIKDVKDIAIKCLTEVGLGDRIYHKPTELSGREQQRVAIARALVGSPQLLLADEPTGALDSTTSAEIMELIQLLNEKGITVILITHEKDVAAYAQRVIKLQDGCIISDLQENAV